MREKLGKHQKFTRRIVVRKRNINTECGHITSVVLQGSYTMVFDNDETFLGNKNVLAGSKVLLGRIRLDASKEAAILVDLPIENLGDAENNTISRLYLYSSKEMGAILGRADFSQGANPKALFEDLNIEIPQTGSIYLYVGTYIQPIDYSSDPSVDATAVAGTSIVLGIPAETDVYKVKVFGKGTGNILSNSGVNYESSSSTSTVMGAVISAMATDFTDRILKPFGVMDIFSFKVTALSSNNVDKNGDPLALTLRQCIFDYFAQDCTIKNIRVEKRGGANGERFVVEDPSEDFFVIDFAAVYGNDYDGKINPGEVAEYVVRADVMAYGAEAFLNVSLEDVFDANCSYTHTVQQDAVMPEVYPLLPKVYYIRGGSVLY